MSEAGNSEKNRPRHRQILPLATASTQVPCTASTIPRITDKLLEGINREAVVLKNFNFHRLSAVVKPATGVYVHLLLSQTGDYIEVFAQTSPEHLGKFQTHWFELQEQLLKQGIYVGALAETTGLNLFSNFSHFAKTLRQSRPHHLEAGTLPGAKRIRTRKHLMTARVLPSGFWGK